MAIRMKEWGMLAAPGQAVRVPVQGLTGWGQAARELGSGLAAALTGGAELATLGSRVKRTGELAAFAERLAGISAELREELAGQPIEDWDYAWQAAASPRYAEAVQELSAESREGGRELARLSSAQASLEARRDRELRSIETARSQWQRRVEEAVSAGDEAAAAEWVEAGRGVFVPEGETEARVRQERSRACLSRWQRGLESRPLETLAELASAQGEALPQGEAEREGLELGRQRAARATRRALAQEWAGARLAGQGADAARVELAARAGLLPRVPQEAPAPDAAAQLAWLRWMDEREDGEDADTDCRLALATAALPEPLRLRWLQRLDESARVPASDRRALSRRLRSLYHAGGLGCPGDAEAQACLLRLLDEGAALLAAEGVGAAADWLRARQEAAARWVCFEEMS